MSYISTMKRKTLYMLLIGFLLSVTVGLANTSEKEQPCSDWVGLVDNAVISNENQVTFDTVFDLQRIDNYTLVSVSPISDNMVKDLQTSNVATSLKLRPELVIGVLRIPTKEAKRKGKLLRTYTPRERGASTQLVFYNQSGKLNV